LNRQSISKGQANILREIGGFVNRDDRRLLCGKEIITDDTDDTDDTDKK
jgi:hypothetical protein